MLQHLLNRALKTKMIKIFINEHGDFQHSFNGMQNENDIELTLRDEDRDRSRTLRVH
jgi:hypothetical protein